MYLDGVDDYTALPKDLYVNTDSAGTDFLSIIGTNLELNSTGQRIGSTAVYKSPVTSSTGAVANNDNYVTFATNLPRVQAVNVSVADGVGKNDLPTGVTGRTFARVPKSLKRISADTEGGGTGKGTIAVVFNADGSFRYTVSAKTTTASSEYWRDKLGTYQFSYTMTYNGVKTAQATVTIVFN
ncbi:hypothetical protein CRENPOLYSF2_830001 [Crenothrix polyspora]|jgi:hypothetical protein|uniref:Uncharacterized protein n=2 Tax=Crenothrix polyspora TaxID=360316 RepID=A0A1R4HIF2_9GAMM|nr:hypothetical protein CRENPOLYSF2_830001 [Crenothrix polyspora]